MSETKHTPGPWCLSDESPMIIEDECKVIVGSASTYPNSGYFPGQKEAEANARLIAAAPELLEALEKALDDSACDGDQCGTEWHELARAAIAKAKGESNE